MILPGAQTVTYVRFMGKSQNPPSLAPRMNDSAHADGNAMRRYILEDAPQLAGSFT